MSERLDEMKGRVKQGLGRVTGDEETEAEGRSEAEWAGTRREVKGTIQETGGHVREGAGRLLGDEEMEAKGMADQLEGRVRKKG
jgi:uncharacterized protein YjbJ (UPF0337 family)